MATTAALRGLGCSRGDLAAAVDGGFIERVRRGTFAVADLPPRALDALRHGGPLCCAAAARSYGIWVLDVDGPAHVQLGPDGRAHGHRGCRCISHREQDIRASGWRVDVVDALLQMRRCCGEEAFFAALESALRLDLVSRSALSALRTRLPRRHRWLVDLARRDADSGLESLLRLRLHHLGIRLLSQVRIPGVGIVDFVVGDCLILEADGATHGGDHRHSDLVRDAVATALGFVTLRFDYALIVHEWDVVEGAVLAAIERGRHLSVR